MGLGFELAVATVYIVEIASTDMRGILGEDHTTILNFFMYLHTISHVFSNTIIIWKII
jgi:hypothetical protein